MNWFVIYSAALAGAFAIVLLRLGLRATREKRIVLPGHGRGIGLITGHSVVEGGAAVAHGMFFMAAALAALVVLVSGLFASLR